MPDPKNRLRVGKIETVGFVGEGDNPPADIVFWKRKAEGDEPVNDPETRTLLQKIYDAVTKKGGDTEPARGDQKMAEFDKDSLPEEARAAFDQLQSQVADLTARLEAAGSDDGGDDNADGGDVLKGLPPDVQAAIEKRVGEAESRIEKAEERAVKAEEAAAVEKRERRMAAFRKSAGTEYLNIQGSVDEKADMLYAIDEHLPEEQAGALRTALAAASTQLGKNAILLGEIGQHGSDADPDSPQARIEALAKQRQEKEPALTYEQAYAKVLEDPSNRGLVAESRRRQ